MQTSAKYPPFNVIGLLTQRDTGWTLSTYEENQIVYSQGDPADSVFYIRSGRVKAVVISKYGKEAIVAIEDLTNSAARGRLSGRHCACLRSQQCRPPRSCGSTRIPLTRILHQNPDFSDYFLAHLLTRTARVQADLVDQLFNSSEMRLARALLLLSNYGNNLGPEPLPVKVNQETLAALIGTTRPRVNFFMNKFRKLGLIKYNGKLEVQKALLSFVLNERPHVDT